MSYLGTFIEIYDALSRSRSSHPDEVPDLQPRDVLRLEIATRVLCALVSPDDGRLPPWKPIAAVDAADALLKALEK